MLEVVDAVSPWPAPSAPAFAFRRRIHKNDIADSDPQTLFDYVAERCREEGLAYLHVIEGDTCGIPVPPFDYSASSSVRRGRHCQQRLRQERANKALAEGRADLIAFGKPFIANPDLVIRLFLDAPLMPLNPETLYGGLEQGYTDYPMLRAVAPNTCFSDVDRAWG